jgi:hypothetical protein
MSEAKAPTAADVTRGEQVYTPFVLRAYDLFVLGFSNRFAWRCASSMMLQRYNRYVGRRHLDIGVGTGWYLHRSSWPVEQPEITLLDLNENSPRIGDPLVSPRVVATDQETRVVAGDLAVVVERLVSHSGACRSSR